MVLTDKDKNILENLLAIANEIYKLYKKLEKAKDKHKYTTKILSLIEKEEQLIELLQLDNETLHTIESIFQNYINVNSSLYLATQAIYENKKYAYCRVLIKLRSYLYKDTKDIKVIINEYLTQYEITLLYKHLNMLSHKTPYLFINYLRRISYILLMEDSELEKDILERAMTPTEEVCDATRLITDYLILEEYLIGEENKKELNIKREIVNIEELKFLRAQIQIQETTSILSRNKIHLNPDKYAAINDYTLARTATLLTFVAKEHREGIYKTWTSETTSKSQLKYAREIISNIENDFLPSVKSLSLVPPLKK